MRKYDLGTFLTPDDLPRFRPRRPRQQYERDGVWADVPPPDPLQVTIRSALLNALAYTDGNVKHAAAALGIPRTTLMDQMAAYGIPRVRARKD